MGIFKSYAVKIVLTALYLTICVSLSTYKSLKGNLHLVVISHGLMGTSEDLLILANLLEEKGCKVLLSKSNEFIKSLRGIVKGSSELREEILQFMNTYRGEKSNKITFVGNSLGGLFMRYCLKLMHENNDFQTHNCIPYKFMTIATPHLGVYHHNVLEENRLPNPGPIKKLVSRFFSQSGIDLFDNDTTSLLYHMATQSDYLIPLQFFQARRLYANLNLDLVVPLGTSALLTKQEVQYYRQLYRYKYGIVHRMNTTSSSSSSSSTECFTDTTTTTSTTATTTTSSMKKDSNKDFLSSNQDTQYINDMITHLNDIGWEKIIVHFKGVLPIAHNKICSLVRKPYWLYNNILGFSDGTYVMEDAASWIADS